MAERIAPRPTTEKESPKQPVAQFLLQVKQTALWSFLNPKEQSVLERHWIRGSTLIEIAPKIGVASHERVRQIETDAWAIILHLLPDHERAQILNLLPSMKQVLHLDNQVAQLRRQGLSNARIAQELGKPLSIIEQSAHRLIKEGRIEAAKLGGVRTVLEKTLDKILSENPTGTITFAELARKLKVSRERIRQLYQQITATKEVPPTHKIQTQREKAGKTSQ